MSTIAPVYNPNGLWQVWNFNDIYTGPAGTGQYVPKVGDQVNQIVGNVITAYVVESVSLGSLLSTLTPAAVPTSAGASSLTDVLFGDNPSTYAVYIDKSVVPYALNVDARLIVKGSMITACKIFEGTDLSVAGNVISATYDTSGNYVGENVGLSLVASDAYNSNIAIKVVNACNTSANLLDGELVTAVFYNLSGNVVSKEQLQVYNTGFVRSLNTAAKTVIGIGLISPFLSSTNSNVINYPLNLQMNVANLTGVVYYSDGTSASMAVDGVKFSVSGLSAYSSTSVNQSYSLVATYVLQANESAYGINNVNVPHFSKAYTLITTAANLNYQTQLFAYPVWTGTTYTLEWFLYDMARSLSVDVTNLVTVTTAFNGALYGTKQTVAASVNLGLVNPVYGTFNYTQSIDVLLEAPGTFRQNSATPPNWFVTPISGSTPLFGAGCFATYLVNSPTNSSVNLMGIYSTEATWLAAYYYATLPMVIANLETVPPVPTHFNLVLNGSSTTFPISSWNSIITLSQVIAANSTLYIEFIERTTTVDLQLAVAGVPFYQINSSGVYL